MQDYRNRDYVQHFLDDRYFEALNSIPDTDGTCAVALATTGCLDALDQFPAGSMSSDGRSHYDQTLWVRGILHDELRAREELATRLIDELLAG